MQKSIKNSTHLMINTVNDILMLNKGYIVIKNPNSSLTVYHK